MESSKNNHNILILATLFLVILNAGLLYNAYNTKLLIVDITNENMKLKNELSKNSYTPKYLLNNIKSSYIHKKYDESIFYINIMNNYFNNTTESVEAKKYQELIENNDSTKILCDTKSVYLESDYNFYLYYTSLTILQQNELIEENKIPEITWEGEVYDVESRVKDSHIVIISENINSTNKFLNPNTHELGSIIRIYSINPEILTSINKKDLIRYSGKIIKVSCLGNPIEIDVKCTNINKL